MNSVSKLAVATAVLSTLFSATALGVPNRAGVPLMQLQQQGARLIEGAELTQVLVGNPLLAQDLASGKRYEFVFFHSGLVIQRPQGLHEPSTHGGPSSRVAEYSIEGDRLITRVGSEQVELQLYQLDERIFGYRPGEEEAPRWRILRHSTGNAAPLLVRQLDARGIRPMPEDRLRELVIGHTLTLFRRSTGQYYTATFNEDGTRTVSGPGAASRATAEYGVFGGSLVTTFGGSTFFVTVYDLGGVYLAASGEDEGLVDWEVLSVE